MDAITVTNIQLPDTLEDLTQFVLVGKAKLSAYMLKLKTVNKLSVAQEIRDQTLQEAQEISTALIAAEQRIGELLLAIPKVAGGVNQYNKDDFSTRVEKSKTETIKEMGYSKDEAADYQTMAKNPEVVQRVLDEAIANGEVVTKTQVLREIKAVKDEAAQKEKVHQATLSQKDRKIKELLDQVNSLGEAEPQVIEKIPDDYQVLKARAESADREQARLSQENREKAKKIQELERQLGKDKLLRDADRDVQTFTAYTLDYIRRYGGHVWAFEQLGELSDPVREEFIKSIRTLDSFAQQMLRNLGGNIPNE